MDISDGASTIVKVDLHVHSKQSKRPSEWVLKKLGCPESFTDPAQIYRIARSRGMSLVTITDHNTIDGALEIAHLPGAFISEEITTYFPENGCKLHVLAYNITEAQHREIRKVRESVYDLVDYLNDSAVVHVLAHPLYSVNDRLTPDLLEKLLLLFPVFEQNGARNPSQNRCLERVVDSLTPEIVDRLADKHGIPPRFSEPWRKGFTAGSDDHSGLNIARSHTWYWGPAGVDALLAAIVSRKTGVVSRPPTPQTLAHNLYGIAYQYYRNRFDFDRYVNRDPLMRFLERSLCPEADGEPGLISKIYSLWSYRARRRSAKAPLDGAEGGLMDQLRRETTVMLREHPDLLVGGLESSAVTGERERRWYDFVNQVSNKVMFSFADHLMDHLAGANVFNIFHTVGSVGGLYTLLAPYFVAYSLFTKDREVNRALERRFIPADNPAPPVRVAHFTDTYYEVNGVAGTLRQQVSIARRFGKDLTVITCDARDREETAGVRHFRPAGQYALPEYPELSIFYPPFLEMLDYCYTEGFTHIHAATPGPVGLAALAIAQILKLPINGTYHTAFPQYAQYLTGDPAIEELTWRFTLWYYDHMDTIYVPSRSTGDELVAKGIRPEKIKRFPRGIDVERFHPSHRNGFFDSYGIDPGVTRILYVGRVSKEKNMPELAEVFREVRNLAADVHLIVVGDGPYLEQMKAVTADLPVTFTGYLDGDDLAAAYASSDLFVFPSTTDTFGNVVLEAQASGLPVIVTDQGGPHENILPGETGFVVEGDSKRDLLRAIRLLVADPELARSMGEAGRAYMESRSFEQAFEETWRMYDEGASRQNGWDRMAEAG